jgi:hypothetical protein
MCSSLIDFRPLSLVCLGRRDSVTILQGADPTDQLAHAHRLGAVDVVGFQSPNGRELCRTPSRQAQPQPAALAELARRSWRTLDPGDTPCHPCGPGLCAHGAPQSKQTAVTICVILYSPSRVLEPTSLGCLSPASRKTPKTSLISRREPSGTPICAGVAWRHLRRQKSNPWGRCCRTSHLGASMCPQQTTQRVGVGRIINPIPRIFAPTSLAARAHLLILLLLV